MGKEFTSRIRSHSYDSGFSVRIMQSFLFFILNDI
ncbi:hypothetical protein BMETH_77_0 [methanotrophic bacterial endosymbiont of Bathymodiolus sp.]|nr:hypothetical protein BMETH_77_0 [methanotrophic bacterial endosymbiont of Bathymodiolus sp.]